MPSLFADTHNVIAILEKSDASEGFGQIIDFLSGSYINYALTVSPPIYISCIKQFWNTVVVKRTCDVTRLQALVDKKKIVISEDAIHEILRLDDAEGVVWLPNDEIFAGLAQMGYEKPSTKLTFYKAFFSSQWKFLIHTIFQSLSAKRTSWNEFSTAMASTVICLSKGQRFNFSRYIFDSLVRNVDGSSKFYMYPRFIQLIIQAQVVDLSSYTTRYISPALTQKVFANMRRIRKGCSGVEIPLFDNMLHVREEDAEEEVQVLTHDDVDQENVVEETADDVAQPTSPLPPSPIGRKSVDIDEGIEIVDDQQKDVQVKGRQADTQANIYNIDLDHTSKVIPATEPVVAAVSTLISAAKPKGLKAVPAAPTVSTRKRKGVVIRDPFKFHNRSLRPELVKSLRTRSRLWQPQLINRAFQVTPDVPEIYMQEFWATDKLHHTSIRFKMDTGNEYDQNGTNLSKTGQKREA
nr:hypothetical protein [Tanacetum cinerariifolium]